MLQYLHLILTEIYAKPDHQEVPLHEMSNYKTFWGTKNKSNVLDWTPARETNRSLDPHLNHACIFLFLYQKSTHSKCSGTYHLRILVADATLVSKSIIRPPFLKKPRAASINSLSMSPGE